MKEDNLFFLVPIGRTQRATIWKTVDVSFFYSTGTVSTVQIKVYLVFEPLKYPVISVFKGFTFQLITLNRMGKNYILDSDVSLPGFLTIRPDRDLNRSGKSKLGGLAELSNDWYCHPGHIYWIASVHKKCCMFWHSYSSGLQSEAFLGLLEDWLLLEISWMIWVTTTFNFP